MDEVYVDALYLGEVLGEAVQHLLMLLPVILVFPVVHDLMAEDREKYISD